MMEVHDFECELIRIVADAGDLMGINGRDWSPEGCWIDYDDGVTSILCDEFDQRRLPESRALMYGIAAMLLENEALGWRLEMNDHSISHRVAFVNWLKRAPKRIERFLNRTEQLLKSKAARRGHRSHTTAKKRGIDCTKVRRTPYEIDPMVIVATAKCYRRAARRMCDETPDSEEFHTGSRSFQNEFRNWLRTGPVRIARDLNTAVEKWTNSILYR